MKERVRQKTLRDAEEVINRRLVYKAGLFGECTWYGKRFGDCSHYKIANCNIYPYDVLTSNLSKLEDLCPSYPFSTKIIRYRNLI